MYLCTTVPPRYVQLLMYSMHSLLSLGYSTQRTITLYCHEFLCLNLLLPLMTNSVSIDQTSLPSTELLFLCSFNTGPPARRLPTFLYIDYVLKDYVLITVSYVQIKDSAQFLIIEFPGFHFFIYFFYILQLKAYFFKQTPRSFHFSFAPCQQPAEP